jgi:hypothetical protein
MKAHRLWCNCGECVRFRGRRVPDDRVEEFEAIVRNVEYRAFNPPLIFDESAPVDQAFFDTLDDMVQARAAGDRFVFDPPLEQKHVDALERMAWRSRAWQSFVPAGQPRRPAAAARHRLDEVRPRLPPQV